MSDPSARTTPVEGSPAPAIELRDDAGALHRLADRRGGWTVVYFYPRDDTPGCTIEACQFRDEHDAFGDETAVVWGISPDDAASHAAFRAKFGLPFTLLCDPDHAVADAYGAWGERERDGRRFTGIIRSSFLVGPDLRIVRAWPTVAPDGHPAEVLATIREARAAV